MHIDVLTLFPEMFEPLLTTSIVGRAARAGIVSIECTNFRRFASDNHGSVDDRAFGGGPGMVLMCAPIFDALDFVENRRADKPIRILLSPQGERLTQETVRELARQPWLVVLCGHYEGFDERVRIGGTFREISIGDYILSGGEPAAMVLIDAIVRLLPGALGNEQATESESFSDGLLEYPQYTRPREFRGMAVPDVLLSGDHQRIAAWRRDKAVRRTMERRPDLVDSPALTRD